MDDLISEKTKAEKIAEIFIKEDLIEEAIPKLGLLLDKFPDPWIDSINSNYKTFLEYCDCVLTKYDKEIKTIKT